ncbi:MAG: LptE family protein [Candidatus Omnitrophota bacterium]
MRSLKQYCLAGILCCLVIGLGGCGYSARSLISNLYRTIYVRPFANKIDITSETSVGRRYKLYYPLLEKDITSQVINQFIRDGNLRIAKEEQADLIIEGELIDYRRDALRYTGEDDEEVEEYRISIVVKLKLYDTAKQATLWEVGGLVGDTTYFTQGSQAKSESSAIADALDDLGRRVVDRVVEVW